MAELLLLAQQSFEYLLDSGLRFGVRALLRRPGFDFPKHPRDVTWLHDPAATRTTENTGQVIGGIRCGVGIGFA